MKRAALIVLSLVAVGIVSLQFSSFVRSAETWRQQPAARERLQITDPFDNHVLSKGSHSMSATVHMPREIRRLPVKGYVNAVAWNAEGSRLAALSNFGGTVTIWDTKTWAVFKEFHRYGGAYSFNSLAFLPDGTLLTATPIGDYSQDPRYANTPLTDPRYNTLQIFSLIQWNPETAKPVRYIPDLGYPPKDLSVKVTDTFAVSANGSLIAGIGGGFSTVLLYDARRGVLLHKITLPSFVVRWHRPRIRPKWMSPQQYWSFPDGRIQQLKDVPRSLAFSPNGRELAVGTASGKVEFFNVHSGALTHSITAYTQSYSCSALAYSPNGKLIAVGKAKDINVSDPNDISTTVWRVRSGTLVTALTGSTQMTQGKPEATAVETLAWSPAGNVIAVGDDGSLRLWQVDHATPTLLLDVEKPGTFSIKYSPQGVLAVARKKEVLIYQ